MPQHQPSRIEKVAASAQAMVVERFGIPLVALMLGLLGFFAKAQLDDIKSGQTAQADAQRAQGADIAAVKSDVRVLSARVDAGLVRQVDTNTKRLDRLDERVQLIEQRLHP